MDLAVILAVVAFLVVVLLVIVYLSIRVVSVEGLTLTVEPDASSSKGT